MMLHISMPLHALTKQYSHALETKWEGGGAYGSVYANDYSKKYSVVGWNV